MGWWLLPPPLSLASELIAAFLFPLVKAASFLALSVPRSRCDPGAAGKTWAPLFWKAGSLTALPCGRHCSEHRTGGNHLVLAATVLCGITALQMRRLRPRKASDAHNIRQLETGRASFKSGQRTPGPSLHNPKLSLKAKAWTTPRTHQVHSFVSSMRLVPSPTWQRSHLSQ